MPRPASGCLGCGSPCVVELGQGLHVLPLRNAGSGPGLALISHDVAQAGVLSVSSEFCLLEAFLSEGDLLMS